MWLWTHSIGGERLGRICCKLHGNWPWMSGKPAIFAPTWKLTTRCAVMGSAQRTDDWRLSLDSLLHIDPGSMYDLMIIH